MINKILSSYTRLSIFIYTFNSSDNIINISNYIQLKIDSIILMKIINFIKNK